MRKSAPRVHTFLKQGLVDDEGRHWLYAGHHNDDWDTWYVYYKGKAAVALGDVVYLGQTVITVDRMFHHRGFKVMVSSERS